MLTNHKHLIGAPPNPSLRVSERFNSREKTTEFSTREYRYSLGDSLASKARPIARDFNDPRFGAWSTASTRIENSPGFPEARRSLTRTRSRSSVGSTQRQRARE